jgi:hypothetical protein
MSNEENVTDTELDSLTYLSGQFHHLGAGDILKVLRSMNGNLNWTIDELRRLERLKKVEESEKSEKK